VTNEEFHGMLMAALHGPHAREIAEQVASSLDTGSVIDLHDAMHEGEREALWSLVHLAIADHLPSPSGRGMMKTIMRREDFKAITVTTLKKFAAGLMRSSKGKAVASVAEVLGIDLEGEAP
jgi:hypothetical protein